MNYSSDSDIALQRPRPNFASNITSLNQHRRPPHHQHHHQRRQRSKSPANKQVQYLATTLQDTNKNLKAVDRMLEKYRDAGINQEEIVENLKDNLVRTTEKLKSQQRTSAAKFESDHSRQPTSPLVHYDSDDRCSRGGRPRSSSVRFQDEAVVSSPSSRTSARRRLSMDNSGLHLLHQSVRDIGNGQSRIEDDLTAEIDRRNRQDYENKKAIQALSTNAYPNVETSLTSLDRKLESIQDQLRSSDTTGTPSLKQVLLTNQRADELQSSNEVLRTTNIELQKTRSRLDESHDQQVMMKDEIDKLKRQLRNVVENGEIEHKKLTADLVQQQQQQQQQQQLQQQQALPASFEQRRLQEELYEARAQLGKSAATISDHASLQRQLQRSETQRAQLSDHIQSLTFELEDREKRCAKLITQGQLFSEQIASSELIRGQQEDKLADFQMALLSSKKESETRFQELAAIKDKHNETNVKHEETKFQAAETIKQWQNKCAQLERDTDRAEHSSLRVAERNEALVADLEAQKLQNKAAARYVERAKREFSDLLALRATLDEQVRAKDIQVNELKTSRMEYEKELNDSRNLVDKLQSELHLLRDMHSNTSEEKNSTDEKLQTLQSSHSITQTHIKQLQDEIKDRTSEKSKLLAQLSEANNEKMEYKEKFSEIKKNEAILREEISSNQKRIKDDKQSHNMKLDSVKSELQRYKQQCNTRVQEMCHRFKKDQAEYSAEIQAMKLQLHEERANQKSARKRADLLKDEVNKISNDLTDAQSESTAAQLNYGKLRDEFISHSHGTEAGLKRSKGLELELLDSKDKMKCLQSKYQMILNNLSVNIDGVIEIVTVDSADGYKCIPHARGCHTDPETWYGEIKNKLDWVKTELRDNRDREKRLKLDVRSVVDGNEKDREFLVAEIRRQNDVLDQLTNQNLIYADRDVDQSMKVQNLQEQVEDLTMSLISKSKKSKGKSPDLNTKNISTKVKCEMISPIDKDKTKKNSEEERQQIHDRYEKLQKAMTCLREEISDIDSPCKHLANKINYSEENDGISLKQSISNKLRQQNNPIES